LTIFTILATVTLIALAKVKPKKLELIRIPVRVERELEENHSSW